MMFSRFLAPLAIVGSIFTGLALRNEQTSQVITDDSTTSVCTNQPETVTLSATFSISFEGTLSSTDGTQCIYCESSTTTTPDGGSHQGTDDRLVLEDGFLVLYLADANPKKQTFNYYFVKGKTYNLAVEYDKTEMRAVLFVDSDAYQVVTYVSAGAVTLTGGTLGCADLQGANSLSVSDTPVLTLTATHSHWADYMTKYSLGQEAAKDFRDVARVEKDIFQTWHSCYQEEKALLQSLLSCRDSTIMTWANLTQFSCDMRVDKCDETSIVGDWMSKSNEMMTAIHDQTGDCNYPDIIVKNGVCEGKRQEDMQARCGLSSMFLATAVDANYIGAHKDMDVELENGTGIVFTGAQVVFTDKTYRIPVPNTLTNTSTANDWPSVTDFEAYPDVSTSAIRIWGSADAFPDLNCSSIISL